MVRGPAKLTGAAVTARDIRGGASLILCGLAAEGETVVEDIHYVDRGYERIEEKLSALGADVKRTAAADLQAAPLSQLRAAS